MLLQNNYDNVSEVQAAILEPQGNLSVFSKAENKPVTLKDLNIQSDNQRITLPLIMDGNIESVNKVGIQLC
ncbi:YetF domain-containing protein [Clostridium oryzae]|uniref:YetF C-terminal domain-containing protein n=1 Tax=Clostridium oryzae TaxID=1450648 RepID=A0A1V4IJF7_9CLOT|nr:YetF domain-containing protein [Clostridium oryzae]OPJ59855.1 hypothetical protein CLORY_30720 [Clostridium oryzae]